MVNKKAIALILVSMMVFSGLAILAENTEAQVVNTPNNFHVMISATNLDDHTRYRGENVTFYVRMYNDGSQTLYHCNLSVNSEVHDANGNPVTSPFNWHKQDVNDDVTMGTSYPSDSHTFNGFNAIIKSDAPYGTYNITVHMSFKNSTGAKFSYEGYVLFKIDSRMIVGVDWGNKVYPGELHHTLAMDVYSVETVHDVYWNISSDDHDFEFPAGADTTHRSDFYSYSNWQHYFIFNVTKQKAPGNYRFNWKIEYTVDGRRVSDDGNFNVTVNSLGTIEMSSTTTDIQRGTSTMNVTLSFTNTGNVDLKDLKIKLDGASTAYFTIPQQVERYEGSHAIYSNPWVYVGNITQGQTTTKTVKLIIDSHLPAGEHKVLFDFKATYANGTVYSYWSWDSSPMDGSAAHYMPRWRAWDSSWRYYPDDSRTLHPGAFVFFNITGDVFDMELTASSTGIYGGSVSLIREDNMLKLRVENNEYRDYRDLSFFVSTGADSPFINPTNPASDWSEPYNVSWLNGGSSAYISLHVKTKPGISSGYYDVPVRIRATDMTSYNTVENTVTARILITGSGAKPVITGMNVGDIKAGKTFTVTITVKNEGDDVARNLMINLAVDNSLEGSDIALVSGPPKIDSLAPGENATVQFTFVASSSLKGSQAYPITAYMSYDNMYRGDSDSTAQQVGIQSPSRVTTPEIMSWLIIILLILAIIGAILLMVKGMKKKEEPATTTVAPAPAPEPAAPVEEYVPEQESNSGIPAEPVEDQEMGEELDTEEETTSF